MIELTSDQAQAVACSGEQPPLMVNRQTQETFVLVRQDLYERMQKWFGPLKRRWDNPADDDPAEKAS